MIAGLGLIFILLALVPAAPDELIDAVSYVWGLVQGLEVVFPVSTFITIIGLILQSELIIFQLRGIRWIWIRLRGSGQ